MKINYHQGYLVAVDSPDGTDNLALIQNLRGLLIHNNFRVYCTKEPTSSRLGDFIKSKENTMSGEALICMVTADRYSHIQNEILPKLREGYIVILDGYILSSLKLYCMNNINKRFLIDINRNIIKPDLQIVVTSKREDATMQLEKQNKSTLSEAQIMEHLNVNVFHINDDVPIEDNVRQIYGRILSLIKKPVFDCINEEI